MAQRKPSCRAIYAIRSPACCGPQNRLRGGSFLPQPSAKPPKPYTHYAQLTRLGVAVTMCPAECVRYDAFLRKKVELAAARKANPSYCLPLVERLAYTGPPRRRHVRQRAIPRVLSLDWDAPRPPPVPSAPRRDDAVSGRRTGQRLAALASLRENMARHVRRLARWNARRAAGLVRRWSPLKPGRPPGSLAWHAPKNRAHDIHELLKEAQWLARERQERLDTS